MEDNEYRKDNYCPYCNYFCDCATITGVSDPKAVPKPGDLSFCMMCCRPMKFGENMRLEKFDIDSLESRSQRNRLTEIRIMMELYWIQEASMEDKQKREEYLKNL